MIINLPINDAITYSSESQKIRVITENWVLKSIFCPNCGTSLYEFDNNKPVADFFCKFCGEEFELKSKQGSLGKKIVDGAFSTMLERLNSNNNPNFFFLTYDKTNYEIKDFLTIPKYFFIPSIIEVRKPLNVSAIRAGWIGCNIAINNIPEIGKIYYIQKGVPRKKKDILENWQRTNFVKNTHNIDTKGWLLDVLLCVEKITDEEFSLADVYQFESSLKSKHPSNNNIKAKIRQQLQFLRDKEILDFLGNGKYKKKITDS